ncbi:MAG TPA: hypothetical protein VFM19_03425, partial [Candidatus Limnocylindria bacterium]|nr:hypothetical protein [Candidatus Limnocylindria bacterium]
MLRGLTRPRSGHRLTASAGILSMLFTLMLAAPVAADTVAGDALSDPIPIAAADFGTPQAYDTTGATEDAATDPSSCETEFGTYDGPFTETVWHSFMPEVSGELLVDVNSFPDPEAEGFLAIVFVYADDGAGGIALVGCSALPAAVQFAAEAGTTYYAMTGSLPEMPGGGPALITVAEPVLSDATLDQATYDPQEDSITVFGSVTCAEAAGVEVYASAAQTIGTHTVWAEGSSFFECEGVTSWSVTLTGVTGPLNPGSIDVSVDLFACGQICSGEHLEGTVAARPVSNRPGPEPPAPPPAPDNDEREGAFPIALGGTAEQDVSGATASDSDP